MLTLVTVTLGLCWNGNSVEVGTLLIWDSVRLGIMLILGQSLSGDNADTGTLLEWGPF